MSLLFRYQLVPCPNAVHPLGGRWVRPRPLVPVTLIGPASHYARDGLLDTGADDTVFPEFVAAQLGIDLSGAPTGEASGVGATPVPVRYAEVTLRIAAGTERREWRTAVGFAAVRLRYPLLGFAGFLQFFTATFRGDREEVELAVNALYPGT